MSKSPRALQELMTAVDAGQAVDVYVDSASSDSRRKLLGPRRRRSTNYGRPGDTRNSAPAVAVAAVEASSDASFEFSAGVVSYSSASPASMVFSDGQLRAHQFPAVRSSADSSQATSPLRSSSTGSSYSSTSSNQLQAAGMTGSKKRVSFAVDGADKAGKAGGGGGQGMKKSGGLLGCMSSACWPSSRNEAVEPAARNDHRKVVAV